MEISPARVAGHDRTLNAAPRLWFSREHFLPSAPPLGVATKRSRLPLGARPDKELSMAVNGNRLGSGTPAPSRALQMPEGRHA
jgi:hypothetical protein